MPTPEQTDLDKLAKSLTKARKTAVELLSREWIAGPELPKGARGQRILWLSNAGLVEREFGDMNEAWQPVPGGLKVRLSACWWYRLTPLGLALRNHLKGQNDGHG